MNQNYFFKRLRKFRLKMNAYLVFMLLAVSAISTLHAQVNEYVFSQTNGSFSAISGGTVLGTATANTGAVPSLDTTSFPVTLPFGFNFSGQNYTAATMSSNGYITFGTGTATGSAPLSATTAYDGAIAAWGRDINAVFNLAGKTGNMSWTVEGTAPNRTIVFQWENFRPTSNTSTTVAYVFSFQIRLAETTNVISTIYSAGAYLLGTTSYASTVQIGLRGATNADFNNRINPATSSFESSTAGTANNSTQAFSTTANPPGMPGAGLTYMWTPPTCFAPSAVSVTNITTTSATVNWTAAPFTPANGYAVYYSATSTPPTATTVPTLTGLSTLSTTISGLSASTPYFVWVRSSCATNDNSTWSAVASFSTQCQPPAIISTTGAVVCPNNTATLSATADAGASVKWYDALTGGNLLATGPTYTTPVITSSTNYYVAATTGTSANVGKVGLESNASTGGGLSSYLLFDALSDFTLNTVDLFPYSATAGTAGTVTITLRSSTGTLLNSATVNVTGANSVATSVAQTVTLNFPIIGGQSYRLGVSAWTGVTNLYRDATNLAFPYSLPGIVDITGGSLATPYYYFFYNWNVLSGCESARTVVAATYDPTCTMGTSEAEDGNIVSIYPNPFTDVVSFSEIKNVTALEITDASGRLVKTIKPAKEIYLGELKAGMYFIKLKMKDGTSQNVKALKK